MAVHRIYFNAKNWDMSRSCPDGKVEKCFISGLFGRLEEVFVLGDWSDVPSEIISKPMMLEQNSIYHFCFWLKGGENKDGNEVCQLQVMFDGKMDQVNRYRLSQNYITPIKEVQGWRLYDISFETNKNSVTQLKFIAQKCSMTIMAAGDPEEYKHLQDTPRVSKTVVHPEKSIQKKKRNPFDFGPYTTDQGTFTELHNEQTLNRRDMEATEIYQKILSRLDEGCMQQQIINEIVEELTERIRQNIDLESLVKECSDSINTKELQEELRRVIKEHIHKTI